MKANNLDIIHLILFGLQEYRKVLYVIDPKGLLYKCWADVDIKKQSIGTLETVLNNFDIMSKFIQGSDNFSDSKCLN